MMKSGELVVLVDSVEEAVKFYTEKLTFDIIDLIVDREDNQSLFAAHLRKGKCFIQFRKPHVEELAEFSFIKRCASRCVCLNIEMKNGLDKLHTRYKKKKLSNMSEPKNTPDGKRVFSLRDPFGIKIVFSQPQEGFKRAPLTDFFGLPVNKAEVQKNSDSFLDKMIVQLKKFGVLRRAAKKYAKLVVKSFIK